MARSYVTPSRYFNNFLYLIILLTLRKQRRSGKCKIADRGGLLSSGLPSAWFSYSLHMHDNESVWTLSHLYYCENNGSPFGNEARYADQRAKLSATNGRLKRINMNQIYGRPHEARTWLQRNILTFCQQVISFGIGSYCLCPIGFMYICHMTLHEAPFDDIGSGCDCMLFLCNIRCLSTSLSIAVFSDE